MTEKRMVSIVSDVRESTLKLLGVASVLRGSNGDPADPNSAHPERDPRSEKGHRCFPRVGSPGGGRMLSGRQLWG